MKLKDILKTDTDNKGWLRVFKKLGADAEMLKYVNENISKSGGDGESGEGAKEYYYRLNTEHENYLAAVEPIMFLMIKDFIYNGTNIHRIYGVSNFTTLIINKLISAICMFDYSVNNALTSDDGNNGTRLQIITAPKGNIKEKMSQFSPELEDIIDEIFIPITKEEYENLITQ